jgi:hypothetical protein
LPESLWQEQSGYFILHDFRDSPQPAVRHLGRLNKIHRFENAQTKAFGFRGEQPDVSGLQVIFHVPDVFPHDDRSLSPSRCTSLTNGEKSPPARMTSLNDSRGRMSPTVSSSKSMRLRGADLRNEALPLRRASRVHAAFPYANAAAHVVQRNCGCLPSDHQSRALFVSPVLTASEQVSAWWMAGP